MWGTSDGKITGRGQVQLCVSVSSNFKRWSRTLVQQPCTFSSLLTSPWLAALCPFTTAAGVHSLASPGGRQLGTETSPTNAPILRSRDRGTLGCLLRVFVRTTGRGERKKGCLIKPHDKWQDKGNSITPHNDVTKKDEELK